jgi:hypothetical protein
MDWRKLIDRIDTKDIVKKISRVIANLNKQTRGSDNYYRTLGGLEGMLICIGKSPLRGPINYRDIEKTKTNLWGKTKTTTRKELYEEYIIRIALESIEENL